MTKSVVVTGLGVVSPLGDTEDTVVQNLKTHSCGLTQIDLGLDSPLWFGYITSDFEHEIDELPSEHSLLWKQLASVDPGLLYGYVAALRAVADAGLEHEDMLATTRTASTVSSSKGFLRLFLNPHKDLLDGAPLTSVKPEYVLGFSPDTLGRLLAHRWGFNGPVLSTSAACATGLHSLILGAHLIIDGIADIVLCGSAECTRNQLAMTGFYNMGALSRDMCRPFDKSRSGFNPGEGAGVFVLESEEHALAREARIRARLAGWDYRSEAYHVTAVEPHSPTAEYAVQLTLRRAGWTPESVEYINAHGTGTLQNDRAEALLINRVFGQHHTPLVSSLKGHIGHLLGASASAELALVLMALSNGFIPPTLRLETPDPECPVNHVHPNGEERSITRFLKFSLGFGGHVAIAAFELPK